MTPFFDASTLGSAHKQSSDQLPVMGRLDPMHSRFGELTEFRAEKIQQHTNSSFNGALSRPLSDSLLARLILPFVNLFRLDHVPFSVKTDVAAFPSVSAKRHS
jgi:hypothetical protein